MGAENAGRVGAHEEVLGQSPGGPRDDPVKQVF